MMALIHKITVYRTGAKDKARNLSLKLVLSHRAKWPVVPSREILLVLVGLEVFLWYNPYTNNQEYVAWLK